MLLRRALLVVAASLAVAGCTSGGPAARGTTTTSSRPGASTTTTLPPVLTNVTPAGWVPVEYGDVQISVPADWKVFYDALCPTNKTPGAVYVGRSGGGKCLGRIAWGNAVFLGPLTPGAPLLNALAVVNGINTWFGGSPDANGWQYYAMPSFGVLLSVHGSGGSAVAKTLTRSPATVSLATGAPPVVPETWHWVTGGDVRFAVPASWPTGTGDVEGPLCALGIALFSPEKVLLDSDQYIGPFASCPVVIHPRLTPVAPVNGVVVDLHPKPGWPLSPKLGRCLHLHGLTACVYDRTPTAELDVLFVEITVPGHAGHELLEIGLAGDGMVARTILHSLRAA